MFFVRRYVSVVAQGRAQLLYEVVVVLVNVALGLFREGGNGLVRPPLGNVSDAVILTTLKSCEKNYHSLLCVDFLYPSYRYHQNRG